MNKKSKLIVSIVILISAALFIGACADSGEPELESKKSSNQEQTPAEDVSFVEQHIRTDSQNGVSIDVVWSTPELYSATGNEAIISEYQLDEYLVFDLNLTTHSGDLRDYPYMDNATLLLDGEEISPVNIDIVSNDSHHPRVLVKFPLQDEQGEDYLTAATTTIELVLKDLRDVPERTFTWELPL